VKLKLIIITAIASSLIACGKKSNSNSGGGATNPIPSMVAIAKAVLPSTLESSSVSLMSHPNELLFTDTNLTELKNRVFSPGPTDFMFRLNSVDSRLNELATRISSCASATTQTFTPPAFVSGLNFPMKFGCVENIDAASLGVSDFKVYFGKDNGYWYLAEVTTSATYASGGDNPPNLAVMAKVSEDGSNMEVWQVSVQKVSSTDYSGVLHIVADKTAGIFSLTTASDSNDGVTNTGTNYSGLGCGVHMITDSTNVYAAGKFSQAASCPTAATVCSAIDLATAGSCSSLSSSSALVTLLTPSDISSTNAKSLIIDRTGFPTF
jgi:hypothetical protein